MKAIFITIALLLLPYTPVQAQNIFVVNSLDDQHDFFPGNGVCMTVQGVCTFRAALDEANALPNGTTPDLIVFDDIPVSGGVAEIDIVFGSLPPILETVIIDAETATGEVRINGALAGNTEGMTLSYASDGSKIRGLTIGNFEYEGLLIYADNVLIENNYIGITRDGTDYGNGSTGIRISGNNNQIGGILKGNVIGFNEDTGIVVYEGRGTLIRGNYIGTDPSYREAPNRAGIYLAEGPGSVIGGPTSSYGNIIGFNTQSGIVLFDLTEEARIRNNYIGTNEVGSNLGNGTHGIVLDAPNNLVGGSKQHGNIIGYNDIGILISRGSNRIKGNFIGTNEAGQDRGNRVGIQIVEDFTDANQIGYNINADIPLDTPNANTIAYNNEEGILIGDSSEEYPIENSIRGNHIYENGEAGINLLGSPGPDANDSDDSDTGPNHLLNHPDIQRVDYNGSFDAIGIEYSISSDPAIVSYPITVDFYIADDPISGEGKTYIGSDTYTTQNSIQLFDIPATSITWASTDVLVLTSTDADGNTSEFSPASNEIGGPGHTLSRAFDQAALKPVPVVDFELASPYPNPFSQQTTFTLRLPKSTFVRMTIHDALGRQVATLHEGHVPGSMSHTFQFDAQHLASGTYFLNLYTNNSITTRRLVLAK